MMSESIVNSSGTVETKSDSGLKHNYLNFVEVLAQSIGGIAPSGTPTLVIPLVFAAALSGTWLAYLFALAVVILIGINLNVFTKRSASPGSLYEYIVKGLGSGTGVVAGWALVLAYLLTASAVYCGFINYASVLFDYSGLHVPFLVLGLVGALIAWLIAFKDIRLSANLMLIFEAVSILLIITLAVVVLVKHGLTFDLNQFTLKGTSLSGIGSGLVLAFFSFTCFESAVSLGGEAKKPLKNIPKAVTVSTLTVGLFFVILSYTEVFGYVGSTTTLDKADAPLALLASLNKVDFFGPLISIGALISFWSSFLACTNAGARILFSLGRNGVLPQVVGKTHKTFKTPHVAIAIIAAGAVAVPSVLIALGNGLFTIYGWVGTVATFGFLLIYALTAIAAPVYLRHEHEFKARYVVLSAVTVLLLLIPILGSIIPSVFPVSFPAVLFPIIFVAWLLIGGLVFFFRKHRNPNVHDTLVKNIDDNHDHYRDLRQAQAKEEAQAADPAALV